MCTSCAWKFTKTNNFICRKLENLVWVIIIWAAMYFCSSVYRLCGLLGLWPLKNVCAVEKSGTYIFYY